MFRSFLLWLSERRGVAQFARGNRVARRIAERFVAGETTEQAIQAAGRLRDRGLAATLDLLGENVTTPGQAIAAADHVLELIEALAHGELEVNVSVKLTQLGLDLDPALCDRNLIRILQGASARRGFVRIDMESSDYTSLTLDGFLERWHPAFPDSVGVVIQSALRRSPADLERLVAAGARVRLCKGAYREPPEVAWPRKADVDRQYLELMETLLRHGTYPAIATHDERMLSRTRAFAEREGIGPERFEFQMLYGVRRDLQARLRADGYRVRVYVPFGGQWYPYLMRRLAERPANIVFILGNLVREGLSRR